MEWYVKVLQNYAVFQGRARRKEYWMFVLVNVIISIVLGIVEAIVGVDSLLSGLYSLAIIVPSLAVGARRLHDIGKSGWWQLIGLIPIIGLIILLIFYCTDSVGDNQYGPNPKAA
ncbi:DUF805 domain-containing protein [Cohnella suwonensis]|uniref:DUF805 domain-containing protein n=1 Tax=Cohnella suwonensis TaxID=696072 RepID=A0ABW0LQQ5_9BACL